MGNKVYRVVVAKNPKAERTGQGYEGRATGLFPSRLAFARALIAAELAPGPEVALSRFIRKYGDAGVDDPRITEMGQLYVTPLHEREPLIPWPPKEA